MKVTLESTTKVIEFQIHGNLVPARVWEGKTESGIAVHAYITLIAVQEGQDVKQFEEELMKRSAPSPYAQALPFRMVI